MTSWGDILGYSQKSTIKFRSPNVVNKSMERLSPPSISRFKPSLDTSRITQSWLRCLTPTFSIRILRIFRHGKSRLTTRSSWLNLGGSWTTEKSSCRSQWKTKIITWTWCMTQSTAFTEPLRHRLSMMPRLRLSVSTTWVRYTISASKTLARVWSTTGAASEF